MSPRLVPVAIVLSALVASGCIRVKAGEEAEVSPIDAGAAADSALVDAAKQEDASAGPPVDASVPLPNCPVSGASGFCESFDTAELPGSFARVVEEGGGTATRSTAGSTNGPRSMRSSVPPGTDGAAALETQFSSTELSIEFDLRPERLNAGSKLAPAYVVRVQFDETKAGPEPYHMLGLIAFAANGTGALKLVDFKGLTSKYTEREPGIPLTLGAWMRLRFTVTRTGFVTVYDVTKDTLLATDKIDLNADVKPQALLRLGVETFEDHRGFDFSYDTVVVQTR